jgi:hypothetical protein
MLSEMSKKLHYKLCNTHAVLRNILLETFLAEILHFIKLCYYEFNSAWLANSTFLALFPYGRNGRKD